MRIRGEDVLLPTTLVGAYPQPVFMGVRANPAEQVVVSTDCALASMRGWWRREEQCDARA